jgi:hypothetical protein
MDIFVIDLSFFRMDSLKLYSLLKVGPAPDAAAAMKMKCGQVDGRDE